MINKGYYDSSKWPYRAPDVRLESHTVICMNCNATWKEEMPALNAIAGYARKYDFCSICEQEYIQKKHRLGSLAGVQLNDSGRFQIRLGHSISPTSPSVQSFSKDSLDFSDRSDLEDII